MMIDYIVRKRLSVIVPCYNEAEVIDVFVDRMTKACQECVGENFEIILVDDGSSDETMELIVKCNASDPRIVGLQLFRNHGHQLAASAGLQISRGDRVLLIDADLQDPPELLPAFAAKMDEGYDVVYGRRTNRSGETWFKKLSASLFYRGLTRLTDTPIPLDTGDFRLMTREITDFLNEMPERHRFLRGMVSWIGGRQVAYDYQRDSRLAGKTKYTLSKMIALALDAITGFSTFPLRLATYLAFASVFCALILAAYILYSYFYLSVVEGWTSLGFIILILSSAQLLALGLLGEYVGRLYVQQQGRPTMLVRRILRSDSDPEIEEKPKSISA